LVEGDALVRQYASEETLSNIMALSEKRNRREEVNIACLNTCRYKQRNLYYLY
jgi:hypothetical protein